MNFENNNCFKIHCQDWSELTYPLPVWFEDTLNNRFGFDYYFDDILDEEDEVIDIDYDYDEEIPLGNRKKNKVVDNNVDKIMLRI